MVSYLPLVYKSLGFNFALTFVFLCGAIIVHHICYSAVLMVNYTTQQKGLNIIFSLFVVTKINSYMKN